MFLLNFYTLKVLLLIVFNFIEPRLIFVLEAYMIMN